MTKLVTQQISHVLQSSLLLFLLRKPCGWEVKTEGTRRHAHDPTSASERSRAHFDDMEKDLVRTSTTWERSRAHFDGHNFLGKISFAHVLRQGKDLVCVEAFLTIHFLASIEFDEGRLTAKSSHRQA